MADKVGISRRVAIKQIAAHGLTMDDLKEFIGNTDSIADDYYYADDVADFIRSKGKLYGTDYPLHHSWL